jgi:hypothetical protein
MAVRAVINGRFVLDIIIQQRVVTIGASQGLFGWIGMGIVTFVAVFLSDRRMDIGACHLTFVTGFAVRWSRSRTQKGWCF